MDANDVHSGAHLSNNHCPRQPTCDHSSAASHSWTRSLKDSSNTSSLSASTLTVNLNKEPATTIVVGSLIWRTSFVGGTRCGGGNKQMALIDSWAKDTYKLWRVIWVPLELTLTLQWLLWSCLLISLIISGCCFLLSQIWISGWLTSADSVYMS